MTVLLIRFSGEVVESIHRQCPLGHEGFKSCPKGHITHDVYDVESLPS
jgi:hypothetical protein